MIGGGNRALLALLPEMYARTGSVGGFSHPSWGGVPAGGVATSLCAMLLAEACNTRFEPLIGRDNAALNRSNAILVAARNRMPFARAWGGGEVGSADRLPLVVPVGTIHLGPARTATAWSVG